MIIPRLRIAFALATLLVSACHEQGSSETVAPPLSTSAASPSTAELPVPKKPANLDQWLGRWSGVEGTYLSIAKHGEGFTLEIADLDGPKRYEARGAGEHLEFERDGKIESIRATDGKQTGMKWLGEKSDCLTIKTGEGFCRD